MKVISRSVIARTSMLALAVHQADVHDHPARLDRRDRLLARGGAADRVEYAVEGLGGRWILDRVDQAETGVLLDQLPAQGIGFGDDDLLDTLVAQQ